MLSYLDLRHFKCFKSLHLPLAPLTLLSGRNASGKSSALQALVLLHQTMREHEWSRRLMLNGKSIKLGTVVDVVNESQGGRCFEIGVTDNEQNFLWSFASSEEENRSLALSLNVDSITINESINELPQLLRYLFPSTDEIPSLANRLRNLTYITAERIGPREIYTLEDKQLVSSVGHKGEYAASLFYWGKIDQKEVLEDLLIKTESSPYLFRQVPARMRQFFPGFGLDVDRVKNANAVTLGLHNSDAESFRRPINTGFGLTQVLPIVIAALSAQKEDILLIENPEVHLHPEGQALMGQFLAEVARAGVQVILETHSDHILNGIRLAVHKGIVEPKQTCFHYFERNQEGNSKITSPKINEKGRMDDWPDGFFDEWDKALFELV
jgi:predicted ATPase